MSEILIVESHDEGQRLDRWIKKRFPGLPFTLLQKILRTGQIRLDGKRAKGEQRLSTGQNIRLPPQLVSSRTEKEISVKDTDFIRSLVIYQDADLIILNKPPGLATQGGSKVTRHVDGLLDGLQENGPRPHLVHRLDKETSGLLLIAKSPKVATLIGKMLQSKEIKKIYWALTCGSPTQDKGQITFPLAKVSGPGGERMMQVEDEEGQDALTYYQVLERTSENISWIAFWPRTGRTHQIRVHSAYFGCPLLGDQKYGSIQDKEKRLHLHARRLIFLHPTTKQPLDITAPLPSHMLHSFAKLQLDPEDKRDCFNWIKF